ncbi:MAG: cytochrome c oxidase accessory protein CcoG [Thioclava marina]|uniref:Cytochrome c oxidase accessory protein CcoG n=1 Tax=Thioclava marina TaxID=1915077 RepID=A0ABX3MNY0_9RHOB|nr:MULTISPECIES: cytochrome c oxidase accessory protein CcoG [Thioclava]TNE85530.1 MAG: cytochrome c oxidase accessory protein CcoG [Paracoccaceae bacterium]MBC7144326.1 cytochrome c oxidase accessory protein CcoG [Thioclava marina]MBD3802696.1 cytochrome c oxidase accessory protein CcoG [Thioclava sp.]OOY13132.1 cytochrome c oxidase accessory protein CcoG [Thioclava marina]OOY28845.1 cytochrome c oxidase accessory protein CcoG [Thioclava sp. L04-15]
MSSTEPVEPPPLYSAREPVFPRRVKGQFRNLKWVLMAMMLGLYYILPWIRWDRGPELPNQAVLLDLANRRFFFFMIEIWPHEFYFVAGLLIMAGLGLFLFTSALGRVWCGYACPQTVWTDLFILVERWVEGDRNARIRLLRQNWNAEKIRKRVTKWVLWLLIGLATGGAWVFYFTDAPTLLRDLFAGTASPVAYITIAVATATTFAFGGFAREQICIYACPWPRIQAAMMDEDTITIAYREWRGEPRGKLKKGEHDPTQGDCIDCMACFNVCPMGIDIRDGQQLECITCGLCIDACNEMMDKIGKPRGLIGYMALKDEANERSGNPVINVWKHILRPRTLLYFTLWAGIGIGLVVALFMRSPIDFNITPNRDPLYVMEPDGTIRNIYTLRLRNKSGEDTAFKVSVIAPTQEEQSTLSLALEGTDGDTVTVPADETYTQRLYIMAAPGSSLATSDRTELTVWVEDTHNTDRVSTETVFNGKAK